ncbi:MAG: hypothetical protein CMQ46_05625 [Gammaproteobacteria bacterium]|nr:hypothetical protein [Gammaproteobacteria bacterium]MBJ54724.1 hypothetical protein [Gammaproteobacteria bacterium]HBN16153.1 hypothetical protein [Pseudohongiella sp.]|tara:strand:+ start:2110 stop:2472 length:363 start_codon:yes stop_codon:yes gene_type:complete
MNEHFIGSDSSEHGPVSAKEIEALFGSLISRLHDGATSSEITRDPNSAAQYIDAIVTFDRCYETLLQEFYKSVEKIEFRCESRIFKDNHAAYQYIWKQLKTTKLISQRWRRKKSPVGKFR